MSIFQYDAFECAASYPKSPQNRPFFDMMQNQLDDQTEWQAQPEVILIDKDAYHFAVEEFRRGEDRMVFLHLTVHHWTPAIYKEILRNWKLFRECVVCPVYAVGGAKDPATWERFVSRLGFKPLMNVVCENGVERQLFVHQIEKEDEFIHTNHQWHDVRDEQFCHEPVVRSATVSDTGVR